MEKIGLRIIFKTIRREKIFYDFPELTFANYADIKLWEKCIIFWSKFKSVITLCNKKPSLEIESQCEHRTDTETFLVKSKFCLLM